MLPRVLVCHQREIIAYHVMRTVVEIHILAMHARLSCHTQTRSVEKWSPVTDGHRRNNLCGGATV